MPTVGILGGGQLARMLALAGHPMGLDFVFFDTKEDACAFELGTAIVAAFTDKDALKTFAEKCDVITYEFENIPAESVEYLESIAPCYPNYQALNVTQDRFKEKILFRALNIPTPKFAPLNCKSDIESAITEVGLPLILKSRHEGYDGKGQARITTLADAQELPDAFFEAGVIAEEMITFTREISIQAVRTKTGVIHFYPLSQNTHENGILIQAKSLTDHILSETLKPHCEALMTHLDYVGILTIEFFDTPAGFIANEYAPRVHNSFHWTTEGCISSQFENHLRAILDLPIGKTDLIHNVVLNNCISTMPRPEDALKKHDKIHDYKKQAKPGRKVGHLIKYTNK